MRLLGPAKDCGWQLTSFGKDNGVTTQKPSEELTGLRILLRKLETGTTSRFEENEKNQLTRETTAENIERIRLRIVELQLSEKNNA